MKTTILWDHDGVLVETEPWYFKATRISILNLGVELTKDNYLKDMAIGRSAWERARANGASHEEVSHYKANRNRLYQGYLQTEDIEIPGVLETLKLLSASYEMAIVTTAKKEDFNLIHRDRKITTHMKFILANGDYARSKPHPDPYLAALDRFAATRAETIVVEDSERGLSAALAAGIDCVVVTNDFVKGQDLRAATHHIEKLTQLPELLNQL